MNTRTPAALLSLSAVALVSASAEPVAVSTDSCVAPDERVCPIDLPAPEHKPEHEVEPAVLERTGAEQAPPAASMPAGRGLTYETEQPVAAYSRNHSAVWSSLPQFRNAALLDLPPTTAPESDGA